MSARSYTSTGTEVFSMGQSFNNIINPLPLKQITKPEYITRVTDILAFQENTNPIANCIAFKKNGQWETYSTADLRKAANQVSKALIQMGLKKGDSVAIISENRPEWNFVDIGVIQIGCILVPLYPNASTHDFEYILNHAEVKTVFVSNAAFYDKLNSIKANLTTVQEIYTFEKVEGVKNLNDIKAMATQVSDVTLEEFQMAVEPQDTMTLMYTSGTTGTPKGVMITHDNLVFNIIWSSGQVDLKQKRDYPGQEIRALSFLPLCHAFEKSIFYSYLFNNIAIYYAESLETIGADLQEVKPHTFTTVPRLLEKVFEKIETKANALSSTKKSLFRWAVRLGEQYKPEGGNGIFYDIQLSIARKLIFSKWKEALGGNIDYILSGAAALQPRLMRIFWAAGIPVMEGYGQSESTPVFSMNSFDPNMLQIGTVGRICPNIEVKIVQQEGYRQGEGELCCRGRNVMKGYFKSPEITAETVIDGWLHTGDIGVLVDANGKVIGVTSDQVFTHKDPYFVKITDRKKEVFKTSGGKYIAPLQLETKFKESSFIEQMMVVGENQKFPAALIIPAFDNLSTWCKENDIKVSSNEEIVKHPKVLELFDSIIAEKNEPFGNYERIKKYALLPKDWTIESDELTPTMKMKRRVITANNIELIESFYKGED